MQQQLVLYLHPLARIISLFTLFAGLQFFPPNTDYSVFPKSTLHSDITGIHSIVVHYFKMIILWLETVPIPYQIIRI